MSTFNEPVFRRPAARAGASPALTPAFTVPAHVVITGSVHADPYKLFGQDASYMGTHPSAAVTVYSGSTSALPGVYDGTHSAAQWGITQPYGWAGTVTYGTLPEFYGTIKPAGPWVTTSLGTNAAMSFFVQ